MKDSPAKTGTPRGLKFFYYLFLGILSIFGAVVIVQRLVIGMKVTALSSTIAWGMWVAFYIYFIGLSAGSFLLSTLIYVFGMKRLEKVGRMALVSALFALFGGLGFIWMDLGHPWRFWRIFYNWNYTSVLAWESLFYVFYILVIMGELWFLMREDFSRLSQEKTGGLGWLYRVLAFGVQTPSAEEEEKKLHQNSMKWVRILGIVGIPLAIGVHGGTGAIFAVVGARPYWFSGLFPIIFLVSALVSGAALMTFLYAFFGQRDEDHPSIVQEMAKLMVLFIFIDLLLLFAEYLVGWYSGIPTHAKIYHIIMFGPFPYTFWLGQVLMGMLIPILLALLPFTRKNVYFLGLAGLSAVIGIVAVRLNLVIPAYILPVLKGLDTAYYDKRWTYSYFPSYMEWATSIGLIAIVVLLFSVACEILPLFPWKTKEN